MQYLAIDLLLLAGVETPGDKIGKMSVNIGGIVVNDPTKVINIGDAKTVDIIVGVDKFTAEIPEAQDETHAENVRIQKRAKGEKTSQPYLEREAAKAEIEG